MESDRPKPSRLVVNIPGRDADVLVIVEPNLAVIFRKPFPDELTEPAWTFCGKL
jgi:hypothetical protein